MRSILLRVCWKLEDIADRIFGIEKASEFYPSKYFERPKAIRRNGRKRVTSQVSVKQPN